jgi:tubulin-specific chaperone A
MAPPTPLSIAVSSVLRLVKEEASYHRELQQQTKRIQKLEAEGGTGDPDDDEGNREFMLAQEACSQFSFHFSPFHSCPLLPSPFLLR